MLIKSIRTFACGWIFAIAMLGLVPPAYAEFHLFAIDQIFTNADGSVQFVVLFEDLNFDGENLWKGQFISTTHRDFSQYNAYKFLNSLPSSKTSRKRVLVATEGFAALGIVTPDFVVPNQFIDTVSGSVQYAGVSTVVYDSLPTDGVHAIDLNGKVIQNLATNFAGQTGSVTPGAGPPAVPSYQGLWWNAPAGSESGWGINFEHEGDVIFATWFTYDSTGKEWWLSMTANQTPAGTYAGTLYQTNGPAFNAVPFNPSAVTLTAKGTGTLTFGDTSNGTFAYTVNGITQSKSITRQVFGQQPVCTFGAQSNLALATNYQGLWWNTPGGSESGWGINFSHQGDTIFATWFTYGADGTPLWLSVTAGKTATGIYSGTLYQTAGPAFSAVPFTPAAVTLMPVGTATFTFANGNSATFAYTVNGISQTKTITRQVLRSPGTACQ